VILEGSFWLRGAFRVNLIYKFNGFDRKPKEIKIIPPDSLKLLFNRFRNWVEGERSPAKGYLIA